MEGGTTGLDESLFYTADIKYGWGFKMETEELVSKNAITGIGLAYASVMRLSHWAHHLENKVTLDQKHQLVLLDLKLGPVPEIFSYPDNFLQNDCFLANEAPVRCSASLLFLSYECPLLAASSRKPRYLSSHAVPRLFPVLSNSARNFFLWQSFSKALRINWYSSPRVVYAIVTFLASKAKYASFPIDSGKELRKTCFKLTSSTPFKQ
ncbi:hypothetical protein Tco_0590459 [Tanacetum coccineum]